MFMSQLFALFFFAVVVFAQGVSIGLPRSNETVSAGSALVVQIQRPDSLTGSEEVAVVVGLQSCPGRPCAPPARFMGTILYNGPYDPARHEADVPPYENITVQVPSTFPAGTALVGVAHVSLISAGLYPNLETLSQTVTVAKGA